MKLNKVKAMLLWLITFIISSLITLFSSYEFYSIIFIEIIIIFGLGWALIEVHE